MENRRKEKMWKELDQNELEKVNGGHVIPIDPGDDDDDDQNGGGGATGGW